MDEKTQLLAKYKPQSLKVLPTKQQVLAARFSPCGKFLIGGGFDGHVHRWDIQDAEIAEPKVLTGHGGWAQATAFSPDQKHFYSGDSWGKLICWPYTEESPQPIWSVAEAHDGWLRDIAVSPDGSTVATCGRDQTVRLWSATNGKLLHTIQGHDQDVYCVAFHPQGEYLVSGDMQGVVKQWEVKTGKHVRDFDGRVLALSHRLQEVGGVRCLSLSPDGKLLLCAGTKPKNGGNVQGVPTLLLFDWKTGKQKQAIEFGKTSDVYVCDVILHPDGFLMVATSGNPGAGKLMFQRIEDDAPFFEDTRVSNCHAISLHPDGTRFAITTTSKGSNGNGRRIDKEGNYIGNTSPIKLFQFPNESAETAADEKKG